MEDLLPKLIFLLVPIVLMFFGTLLAVSPQKFVRFGLAVGRLMGMSPVTIVWKRGYYLSWRIAGLVPAVFGFFFARFVILEVLKTGHMPELAPPTSIQSPGPQLFTLALGIVFLSGGTLLALRPGLLGRWRARFFPYVTVENENIREGLLLTRLFGALWAFCGLAAIWMWVKSFS